MRLKNFINEAITANATNMEMAIVQVWNKGYTDKKYKKLEETAKSVVEYLKSMGVTGEAEHLGNSDKSPLTDQWKKYGAKNNTPKTDIIIGKYRISVKQKGGSQLISGGRNEVMSLFYTVAENMGITDRVKTDLGEELNQFMSKKVKHELTTGKIKKGEGSSEEQKIIKQMDEFNKRFTKILESKFDANKEFHHEIIKEATTGFYKFGRDSKATAEYILVWDKKGGGHYFGKIDDQYISHLASRSTVNVSFKSQSPSTKGKKVWRFIYNSLRIGIKEGNELNENIFKNLSMKVKKMWRKVVDSMKGILDFLGVEVNIRGKITF